tara:strand:+ start:462 stop:1394 length:933 start_codon:yes stop_codon:yes gene_type:complete
MAPLFKNKMILGVKVESTKGTAVVPVGGDAIIAYDVSFKKEVTMAERRGGGASLGHTHGQVIDSTRAGRATFTTELKSDGTSPYWTNESQTLFNACGLSLSTATYTPSSSFSTHTTITLYQWLDGKLYAIYGAMGTFTIKNESGGRVLVDWDFLGIWASPTDTSIPTPTWETATPMRTNDSSGSLTVHSDSIKVGSFSFDVGNEVGLREDVGAAGGAISAIITSRNPTCSIDPEDDTVANHDFYGKWLAGTQAALAIAVTDGTDTMTLTLPKFQYTELTQADRHGIATLDATGVAIQNSAADDEFTMVMS